MKRQSELRTVSAEKPATAEKAVTRAKESFPTLASEFGSIMSALGSMERLIENAFRRPSFGWFPSRDVSREFGTLGEMAYYPTVDIYEHGNDLIVKSELPGMKREDVSVKFTGDNTLVISGERKSEEKVERSDFWQHECSYGSFSRSFSLPEGCDCEKAKASYKDGVLEIRIPKSEEASKARYIPVE
jgi:HSP20 family protein